MISSFSLMKHGCINWGKIDNLYRQINIDGSVVEKTKYKNAETTCIISSLLYRWFQHSIHIKAILLNGLVWPLQLLYAPLHLDGCHLRIISAYSFF